VIAAVGSKIQKAYINTIKDKNERAATKARSDVKKLTGLLLMAPDTSQIDTVLIDRTVFGSIGKVQKNFISALENSHPDLNILFFLGKGEDISKIPQGFKDLTNVTLIRVQKFTPDEIDKALDTKLNSLDENNAYLRNADSVDENVLDAQLDKYYGTESPEQAGLLDDFIMDEEVGPQDSQVSTDEEYYSSSEDTVIDEQSEGINNPVIAEQNDFKAQSGIVDPYKGVISNYMSEPLYREAETEKLDIIDTSSLADRFKTFSLHPEDVEKVTKNLNIESIHAELTRKSASYMDALNTMEIIYKDLVDIVHNPKISLKDRAQIIVKHVNAFTDAKKFSNDMLTKEVVSLINVVMTTVEEQMDRNIHDYQDVVYGFKLDDYYNDKISGINRLINDRTKLATEILGIIDAVHKIIKFTTDLPASLKIKISENSLTTPTYTNRIINSYVNIDVSNILDSVEAVLKAIDQKIVSIHMVDSSMRRLLQTVFEIIRVDDQVITEQGELVNTLLQQRVRPVLVSSSELHNSLSLFTGASDSGITVSGLIYATQLKGNKLLIDLTSENKLSRYTQTGDLKEQMVKMDRMTLSCLHGDISSLKTEEFHEFLTMATVFYNKIIILADESVTTRVMNGIGAEIHDIFICFRHKREHFEIVNNVLSQIEPERSVVHLVNIDPALDPIRVVEALSTDLAHVVYHTIPNLKEIQSATFAGLNPAYIPEVVRIYTEELDIYESCR